MNNQVFLDEVLNCPICPSGFEKEYRYFCKYQKAVLKTLKEFHTVCENNHINYHVTYGSLIGIIRDGGQIPWDYDIDTFIPASQREELIEALRCDLPQDYYVMCPEIDEKCRHYVIRICPKGFNSAAVHLDVFYYCGAPEDEKSRKIFNKELRLCSQIRFAQKVNIKEESLGEPRRILKLASAKVGFAFISSKGIDKIYDRLIHRYPIEKSKYVVSADFFANWYLFPTRMMQETILFRLDSGEFRIPADYDNYLRLVYGNYLTYPSLDSRIKQVINANKRFRHFESIEQNRG